MAKPKDACMFPSSDQIEKEAYRRWELRGRTHGSDRDDWLAAEWDLTFDLNYRTAARFDLASAGPVYLGRPKPARCRFCEQAAPHATFSSPRRPVPEFLGNASLFSRDICDECDEIFRSHLEPSLSRFWDSLPTISSTEPERTIAPATAFKALTWVALALMPEGELEYFTDALEWASNPDQDEDSGLASGLRCLVYAVPPLASEGAWATLEKKRDDEAPLPSHLLFLASRGFIVEFPVPLGTADQENDGEDLRLLRRSWASAGSPGVARCRTVSPGPASVPGGRFSRSNVRG